MGIRLKQTGGRINPIRKRFNPMRTVYVLLIAVGIWLLYTLGMDVWVHDQTLVEAIKGSPQQFVDAIGSLFGMAWQYKLAALLVVIVVITILSMRRVPEIKSR
jgi:hypothetical protein